MGSIRAFVATDIPQVARLHRSVFGTGTGAGAPGPGAYQAYFARVFLDGPSRDDRLPSLVYQEEDGRVAGFLGVVPRRMTMDGRTIRAAISSQFVVDPAGPAGLVAVSLVRAFLDGPQELSFSDEANDVARRIWERLGGTVSLLHSLHWTRPLRPARLAMSFLRFRRGLAPFAALADPLARVLDGLATRIPRSHFYQAPPRGSEAELSEETFLRRLPAFADGSLRVDYDDRGFRWLLERAARRSGGGGFHKVVVEDRSEVLGWYLYQLGPDGVADVLQIVAGPSSIDAVLDHLFFRTWRQGAIAVRGRLEPRFAQALSDHYCLFHRRGPWMLIHAKKPELLQAFQRGDVFVSRLDGEWCLRL